MALAKLLAILKWMFLALGICLALVGFSQRGPTITRLNSEVSELSAQCRKEWRKGDLVAYVELDKQHEAAKARLYHARVVNYKFSCLFFGLAIVSAITHLFVPDKLY